MALRSTILVGNSRIEHAALGGPSIKKLPPADDEDAVRRIQKSLMILEFSMPLSFPSGPTNEPDGKFGEETYRTVLAFQKKEFPQDPNQWDGRVGKNTLSRMDQMLPVDNSGESAIVLSTAVTTTTRCTMMIPPPSRHRV